MASPSPSPIAPSIGGRRPFVPPLQIEQSPRTPPPPPPPPATTPLTAWHIFYIFGMQGIGSMVLDAGINYALHMLIFARGASLWAFVPATVAGDFAMTAIVQCALTWVIASQLQFLDVRNGLVRPLVVRCLPVQSEVFDFDSPAARKIRAGGAGCDPPVPCVVEDWADPRPAPRPLSVRERGKPAALRRWVRWLSRNDGILDAPELDEIPPGRALWCARLRILRRQFLRGATWSLPFLVVFWPLAVGISYAVWGVDYAPGPLPVAILAFYGGLLGLVTTPLVAAITLHSAACDAAAALALDAVDPIVDEEEGEGGGGGAVGVEERDAVVAFAAGLASSRRSGGGGSSNGGCAANQAGGGDDDSLLVDERSPDAAGASTTPITLIPVQGPPLPAQHHLLLLPPPAGAAAEAGLDDAPQAAARLALLSVTDAHNDPVAAAFSPMASTRGAPHARSAQPATVGFLAAGRTTAAGASSASIVVEAPEGSAADAARRPPGGGGQRAAVPAPILPHTYSARVMNLLHSPSSAASAAAAAAGGAGSGAAEEGGARGHPPLHNAPHPPLHPPPSHPPAPHHRQSPSHGSADSGGGSSLATAHPPPVPHAPGWHGHHASSSETPPPPPLRPQSGTPSDGRPESLAAAVPLLLHGTPPRSAHAPLRTPDGPIPPPPPAFWHPPRTPSGGVETPVLSVGHAHSASLPVSGADSSRPPQPPSTPAAGGRVPPVIIPGSGPRALAASRSRVPPAGSGGGGADGLARQLSHPMLVPEPGAGGGLSQRRQGSFVGSPAVPPQLPRLPSDPSLLPPGALKTGRSFVVGGPHQQQHHHHPLAAAQALAQVEAGGGGGGGTRVVMSPLAAAVAAAAAAAASQSVPVAPGSYPFSPSSLSPQSQSQSPGAPPPPAAAAGAGGRRGSLPATRMAGQPIFPGAAVGGGPPAAAASGAGGRRGSAVHFPVSSGVAGGSGTRRISISTPWTGAAGGAAATAAAAAATAAQQQQQSAAAAPSLVAALKRSQ